MTEPSGLLIINKHLGVTSHDIVWKVRKLYGTKRVGHTGTLDPMASGVLVVLVGRAAKAAEYLVSDEKRYTATLRLGLTTDTEDATGTVLTTSDALPSADEVLSACEAFTGEIMQVPPMYSALKVDGQKLCDLARRGIEVERKARPVTVHSLVCTPTDVPSDYSLDVLCSSGTYIRTLCADIGASLGCGGVMATLERTKTGGFTIDESHTIAELEAMSEEERLSLLIPTERLFDALPAVVLPEFFEKLCRSGCEIYQKKLRTDYSIGQRVRLSSADGRFFALGEVRDYEGGSAIKAIKLFELD
ncbi:MAG: tRNA pseudouridine(55) synthase TruB [Clostridia bacterium]|nr:tRNA pseudouridine(55) synthase TruB [Clostridia bacterium]